MKLEAKSRLVAVSGRDYDEEQKIDEAEFRRELGRDPQWKVLENLTNEVRKILKTKDESAIKGFSKYSRLVAPELKEDLGYALAGGGFEKANMIQKMVEGCNDENEDDRPGMPSYNDFGYTHTLKRAVSAVKSFLNDLKRG